MGRCTEPPSGRGAHRGPPNADPPSCSLQCPGAHEPTDADMEEETLKRKLEELTNNVSDPGASSEEEGKGEGAEPGRSTALEHLPRTTLKVRPHQQSGQEWGPSSTVCG